MERKYNIAIFAYNEEDSIANAIRSIYASIGSDQGIKVFVLANGCTDNTVSIVESMAKERAGLSVVEIEKGDKCNAWNTYVYEYADDAECHFLCDGDVTFSRGAFRRMYDELMKHEDASAVAGVPLSGRGREKYLNMIKEERVIFGNLYGLKNAFLELLRGKGFRLPIGYLVDDNLIGRIISTDIDRTNPPKKERIVYDEQAGYYVRSLQLFSFTDIRIYLARMIRYRLGELQQTKLRPIQYADFPEDLDGVNLEILADLRGMRIPATDFILKGVKKRLEKQYGQA